MQEDNGFEFFNTIVLQPHLKLVTDLGRGYHVRCRYKSREAAAASKVVPKYDQTSEALTDDEAADVDENNDNDKANTAIGANAVDRRDHGRSLGEENRYTSNEIPMPACHMKIYSGKTIAENVKIGDPLTLKIFIDKQDIYGLHVVECMVRDGLGWGEQNLVKFGYD